MAVLNPTMSMSMPKAVPEAVPVPAAVPSDPVGLPRIEDPSAVSPADARVLSRTLFRRLGELEE
ncbi:hypothetical protein AB0D08_40695, partial [Kitasatospora sp. NPDC048540]